MCGEANGCTPMVFHVDQIKPPGAVYIGRGSPWGNPYPIGKYGDRDQVIERFWPYARLKLRRDPTWLVPLRGKDLICHCAPRRCHAEVILYYLRRGH